MVKKTQDGGVRFVRTDSKEITYKQVGRESAKVECMTWVSESGLLLSHTDQSSGPLSLVTVRKRRNKYLPFQVHQFPTFSSGSSFGALCSNSSEYPWSFFASEIKDKKIFLCEIDPSFSPNYPKTLTLGKHFKAYEVPSIHTSRIQSMYFCNGDLITGGQDGKLSCIDVAAGKIKWLSHVRGSRFSQILGSPSDPHLLVLSVQSKRNQFSLCDMRSMKTMGFEISFSNHINGIFGYQAESTRSSYQTASFDPIHARYVASGGPGDDRSIFLWDIRYVQSVFKTKECDINSMVEPCQLISQAAQSSTNKSGRIENVLFSPHAPVLASLGINYTLGFTTLSM
jgi:WD40 repeat protein